MTTWYVYVKDHPGDDEQYVWPCASEDQVRRYIKGYHVVKVVKEVQTDVTKEFR